MDSGALSTDADAWDYDKRGLEKCHQMLDGSGFGRQKEVSAGHSQGNEMDGMDGKSTFEVMKADEDMRWIPVVFLTSIADRKAIYSVLKSKPDGYILKPPDVDKIFEIIEEIFEN